MLTKKVYYPFVGVSFLTLILVSPLFSQKRFSLGWIFLYLSPWEDSKKTLKKIQWAVAYL